MTQNLLFIWGSMLIVILLAQMSGVSAYILFIYPLIVSILIYLIHLYSPYVAFIVTLIITIFILGYVIYSLVKSGFPKKKMQIKPTRYFKGLMTLEDGGAIDYNNYEPDNSLENASILVRDMYSSFDNFVVKNVIINNYQTITFSNGRLFIVIFYSDLNGNSKVNSIRVNSPSPLSQKQYKLIEKFMKKYKLFFYNREKKEYYSEISQIKEAINYFFK